jgi:ribosome modulation factor
MQRIQKKLLPKARPAPACEICGVAGDLRDPVPDRHDPTCRWLAAWREAREKQEQRIRGEIL